MSNKNSISQDDLEYLTDRNAALMLKTPRGGRIILWVIFIFVAAALVWANYTALDEVTVGEGKVIPSSQVQQIQNLEGGILKEINAKVGQVVDSGQVLMTIENTEALSSLREQQAESINLKVRATRLQAESYGLEPKFDPEIMKDYPLVVKRELDLYNNRLESLRTNQVGFQQQIEQKKQEIVELQAKLENLKQSYAFSKEELALTRPAFEQGAVSRVELLQLERQVNQLQGDLEATQLAIPRARSALKEAQSKLSEGEAKFRADAQEDLTGVKSKLDQLRESNESLEDKVSRTQVRSPVKGIVKLSAYDFAIFGGLHGIVENISADTILDEEGNSFYLVRVRTDKNYLGTEQAPLPVIPGMQATVDIITGKKTLLDYLLKPILKAKQNALRER